MTDDPYAIRAACPACGRDGLRLRGRDTDLIPEHKPPADSTARRKPNGYCDGGGAWYLEGVPRSHFAGGLPGM